MSRPYIVKPIENAQRIDPMTAVSAAAGADVVRLPDVTVAALYQAYLPRVRGYVTFRVRDPAEADDLVSEVFQRVVGARAPADPDAHAAWIFRIAHNLVVDHYRRRRVSLVPESVLDRADDAPSLPDRVVRDEGLRAADAAMRSLPGRQRAAVYLRFYEDLPYETVAAVMGIPAATARSLVHRALKRLATTLGEEHGR